MSGWLYKEYHSVGKALIGESWIPVIVTVMPSLELQVYLPLKYRVAEAIPKAIEAYVEEWEIRCNGIVRDSFNDYYDLQPLLEKMALSTEIIKDENAQNPWVKATLLPRTLRFLRKEAAGIIPDEWGITFYPEESSKPFFNILHNGSRDARGLPNIFSAVDRGLYFENTQQWTSDSIQDRLRIITSCLSLLSGSPLTYRLLIGRYHNEVSSLQFHSITNPNAYICPSPFNGIAEIREYEPKKFGSELMGKVEEIHNDPAKEKIAILLSYVNELYMAYHDETKIAFSFQLMEALARLQGISIGNSLRNSIKQDLSKKYSTKMCKNCYDLLSNDLKPEYDQFDEYIGRALDAIKVEETFVVNPTLIKEIAKRYRNEVFHGKFFDDMSRVDNILNDLPKSYRDDLAILLQAVASVLCTNLVLGIDFKSLGAIKRKMLTDDQKAFI